MNKITINLSTSCSRDEAIALLIGLGDHRYIPMESHYDVPDEIDIESECVFCLSEYLDNEYDYLECDYHLAKQSKEADESIATAFEKLNQFKKLISKAEKYAHYFDDEISKGVASAIRLNKSNSERTPHYTLISIHQWAINTLKFPDISLDSFIKENTNLAELSAKGIEDDKNNDQPQVKKRKLKSQEQEEAILVEINRRGYNPMNLPPYKSGLDGVRAEVRDSLINNPLFKGPTIYDKAWERLSKFNLIAYEK